jgi:hypothetical protein
MTSGSTIAIRHFLVRAAPSVRPAHLVNLTNAEIGEIYRVGWAANMELARAIEAKLKEKNT